VLSLMNRLPQTCDQQVAVVSFQAASVRQLQVGDMVRVQAGQAFPGDGAVQRASATADEALRTGELQLVMRLRGEAVVARSYNLGGPVLVEIQRL
jgi:Cu2+-exporting ATPase